jgi:NADH-quinone oxidoreductase subunit K
MSIELLLNAVNLSLIAISADLADSSAQVISLVIIAIAASEAALFMSLFVVLFRNRASLDANLFDMLGNKNER